MKDENTIEDYVRKMAEFFDSKNHRFVIYVMSTNSTDAYQAYVGNRVELLGMLKDLEGDIRENRLNPKNKE